MNLLTLILTSKPKRTIGNFEFTERFVNGKPVYINIRSNRYAFVEPDGSSRVLTPEEAEEVDRTIPSYK